MTNSKNGTTRVLHVLGGLYCGGTESFVMNMFRAIDPEKFQFEFLVHDKNEAHYDKEVLSLGGKIYRIPDRREVGIFKYFLCLFKALLKSKPDVIHSHAMFNSGVIMLASFFLGIKKRISHSHNTEDQGESSLKRKMFRKIMRMLILLFSTDLLAWGKEAAIYLFGRNKVTKGKAIIIKNSVNVINFKVNEDLRTEIRNELGLKEELVICHIGRFTTQKNHEFLINIFQKINERLPHSILILIGEGDLKPTIENKVISLGLSSSVKFLGERKDIPMVLQGVDMFILPSLYEGFPVVLIEAQAAGLNCIVSDAITSEIDLTGRISFIGLNDSIEKWVNEIVSLKPSRVDTTKVMKLKGFDNKTNAKMLGDVYLGHI